MKKSKFLSLFLALAMLITPSGKADVIKPAVHARLRNARLYRYVTTGLERNIALALRSATPQSYKLLIKLLGTYCLIVADHIHWSPIIAHSMRVRGVPRARIPRGISKAFELQRKVHAKLRQSTTFRNAIPGAPIITWTYGRRCYVCNPDLVYDQLPERYRQESLDLVEVLSNFSVTPTIRRSSSYSL